VSGIGAKRTAPLLAISGVVEKAEINMTIPPE
jgi:hypothetical protein